MSYKPPSSGSAPEQTSLLRVLIVDDEALVLAAYARSFGRRVTLKIALGASEAMDVMGREALDVVVTDYLMPGVDGVALLDMVRVLYPSTRRILMSASFVPELSEHLRSGLVEGFLSKPFTEGELFELLRR
jgi:DNA-binding NtrC family response regulator